jgi:Ca2+-transporting ATPase
VLAQLRDPMILLLCGALVVVVLIGDLSDAAIIAAVVVLNTAIGVVQELRAEHAIAALDRLAAPRARVVRDEQVREIDAAELVVGDAVRLDAGDVVPADLCLREAVGVEVDEAAMTGESVPVTRLQGEEVLAGTVVTRGRAVGDVARTGVDSGLGRIAALIAGTEKRPTPLQRRLNLLSRQLVLGTSVLCVAVAVLSLAQGGDLVGSVILAVSLAVAAIPESLPAVVSVALAMGAHRMARHSALVRWLPAVETLGSVTVLASDKTGTLTEGRMATQVLWARGATWRLDGPAPEPDARWERLLRDVVLCNDAVLPESGRGHPVGDPLEVALLVAAAAGGVTASAVRRSWTRVTETPFSSERQWMSTTDADRSGARLQVVKGGPEAVWRLLAEDSPGGSEPVPYDARATADRLAADGLRVLAVADRDDPDAPYRLAGLVGIADPPRPARATWSPTAPTPGSASSSSPATTPRRRARSPGPSASRPRTTA